MIYFIQGWENKCFIFNLNLSVFKKLLASPIGEHFCVYHYEVMYLNVLNMLQSIVATVFTDVQLAPHLARQHFGFLEKKIHHEFILISSIQS